MSTSCGDSNWEARAGPLAVELRWYLEAHSSFRAKPTQMPSSTAATAQIDGPYYCTFFSSLLYGDKKGISWRLKFKVPKAGTQRLYPRSSLLVLPSDDAQIFGTISHADFVQTLLEMIFRQGRRWYRYCLARWLNREPRRLKMRCN